MTLADIIIVVLVLVIVGIAAFYIRKEKKRGVKCVGCPSGGCCSGSCGCGTQK